MEYISQSLERELEKEKPDWKQWIPVYGLREIYRANFVEIAPAINDDKENHPIRYHGSYIYHAVTTIAAGAGAMYGLAQLVEKLF